MTIEMAIRTGKIIAKETNNVAEAEVLKTLLDLAEDYQKVGEGVLLEKMKCAGRKYRGIHYWDDIDCNRCDILVCEIKTYNTCREETKLRLLKNRMSTVDIEKIIDRISKVALTVEDIHNMAEEVHKEQSRRLGI